MFLYQLVVVVVVVVVLVVAVVMVMVVLVVSEYAVILVSLTDLNATPCIIDILSRINNSPLGGPGIYNIELRSMVTT